MTYFSYSSSEKGQTFEMLKWLDKLFVEENHGKFYSLIKVYIFLAHILR